MGSKYKWDFSKSEQAENAKLTDPAEIQKGLAPVMGADLSAVVAEGVQEYLKHKGIDAIDRRYLAFPEAQNANRDPASAFSKRDLEAVASWDELPQAAQIRRRVLFRAFMRNVLCGTSPDVSLADYGDDVRDVKPLLNARALSSTPGEGGYLIPPGFIPYLVRDIPRMSVLFPLVRVWPTGKTDSGRLPTVATNAASSWGSEGIAMSSTDPTFGNATWAVERHNAFATIPFEAVNDTSPELVDTVVTLIQEAMAEERDRVIAYGNGSGRPTGIYQSTSITDVSGVTSITWANLNKILYSVDERWHNVPNARWVLNQNVLNAISSKLDDYGQPLFRPAVGDMPGTIIGKRYVVTNSLPNTALFFGDLAHYFWFDRQDMGMATDSGGKYFETHTLALKVWERVDGKYISAPTPSMARTKVLAGITSLVTPN